jgi:hypothetical protein
LISPSTPIVTSLEATRHPMAASASDLASQRCRLPVVHMENHDDRLNIDPTSMPSSQTQKPAADIPCASDVGQIPAREADIIHLSNYEPRYTVSCPLGNQLSPHSLIRKLKREGIPIQIPTQQYDKPRRVLSFASVPSVLNVSMRGSFDLVDVMPFRSVCTYLASG